MAMTYLRFGPVAKLSAASIAVCATAAVAVALVRALLELAPRSQQIETPGKRMRFVLRAATVPALIAIPLIIPFRVPGGSIRLSSRRSS